MKNCGQLGGGVHLTTYFVGHGVFEDGARKDHALLLVAQEGNADEENGEANLAVVFVPGLFHLNGDVLVRGRVEEGEDCPTCKEETGKGEGVDVGTYHNKWFWLTP